MIYKTYVQGAKSIEVPVKDLRKGDLIIDGDFISLVLESYHDVKYDKWVIHWFNDAGETPSACYTMTQSIMLHPQ